MEFYAAHNNQLEDLSLEGSLLLRIASLSGGICYVQLGPYILGKEDKAVYFESYEISQLQQNVQIGFIGKEFCFSEEKELEFLNLLSEFIHKFNIQNKEQVRKKNRSKVRGKKKGI